MRTQQCHRSPSSHLKHAAGRKAARRPRRTHCQAIPQSFLRLSSSASSTSASSDASKRVRLATPAAVAEPRVLDSQQSALPTSSGSRSSSIEEVRRMLEDMTHMTHRNHPVLQLVQQRLQDGSSPGQRRDGDKMKLGLVVEGGGMRGIVTGAMLMGLLDSGLGGVFDAVYGASAGAINATYFLTGQPEGLDIYTDHLASSGRFLSLKRYWAKTGPPVMDLDYLLEEVMSQVIPLDFQGVIDSRLPLKVVASSLTSLRSEVLGDFTSRQDLVECLKASANVPEIVGPPRRHRGHDLVDAAVFEPLPVRAAITDGCTHVLALCSRPTNLGPAWSKYLSRALANAVKYWLLNPPYMREAWRVEPLHSQHDGQPLEDLLVTLLLQGRALELGDALSNLRGSPGGGASPSGSASPSGLGSLSAGDSTDGGEGGGNLLNVLQNNGLMGGHVYSLFPGSAAAFSPICTDVPTLQAGRVEGYRRAQQLMHALQHAPAAAAARR